MKTFFDTYTFTIPANGQYRLTAYSRFLTLLESTSSTAMLVGVGSAYRGRLQKGLSIELPNGETFSYLLFYNPTGVDVTLELSLSIGRVYDNRLVISGTLSVDDIGNNIETPAAIAVTQIGVGAVTIAADADQAAIIIENTGSQEVWAGDSTVDADNQRGKKIYVGKSIVYPVNCAVYVVALTGANGQVSITRIKKV